MIGRLYKCWECHLKLWREEELVAHRCPDCRRKRGGLSVDYGKLSPWTVEGARRWKIVRHDVGSRAPCVEFVRRRKMLTPEEAASELLTWKTEGLDTWTCLTEI